MQVRVNNIYVFIGDIIQVLAAQLFFYQFARSFTQVPNCFPSDRII